MKILLIRPPQISPNMGFPAGPKVGLPLGLLYIARVLEGNGFEVEILDALADFSIENIDLREEWIHFGLSWDKIEESIRNSQASIIGINNPFSLHLDSAIKVASFAKKALPNSITVVGGPHAASSPETFFEKSKDVDFVVQGEGEHVVVELALCLERGDDISKVDGIGYRKDGQILINKRQEYIETLDELAFPAYHLINLENYFRLEQLGFSSRFSFPYPGSERAVSVITSRGCPFSCTFCAIYLSMGKKWRFHSVEYVLRHLKHLVENYGVKHVHFEDDNLTLNRKRFEALVNGLIEQKFGITWDTPNGVRADSLDRELLEKVKDSGCTYLIVGVESGDQEVLNNVIKKKLDLKKVTNVAAACKETGIDLHAFYVIGFPGEKEKNIKTTLYHALELKRNYNVFPHLNLAFPLVGTELYGICQKKGYLTESDNPRTYSSLHGDKLKREMIKTEDFSPEELFRLSDIFHRKLIRISLSHSLGWLLKNPRALLFISKILLKNLFRNPLKVKAVLKDIYARYLLFENHLKGYVYNHRGH